MLLQFLISRCLHKANKYVIVYFDLIVIIDWGYELTLANIYIPDCWLKYSWGILNTYYE